MECPKCRLISPESAQRCNCGYDFVSRKMPDVVVDNFSRSVEMNAILVNNPALTGLSILDEATALIQSGRLDEAPDSVFGALQGARENMSAEDWKEFARYMRDQHELAGLINEDPMTKRALEKPRGYPGDAVMMDYLYGIHYSHEAAAKASPLGREIYRYIQGRPAGEAVRYRREHIAQLIDRMAADGSKPSVLAIAAGHLREAEISEALASGSVGRFVALDADADSLREVATNYARLGVETVHGSVRHILSRKVKLGTFNFVYAAGLYDYLADNVAKALTVRMFEMTKPGGQMLIPNFAPQVRDRAYMEAFMDWNLIYRDEHAMATLVSGIDPAEIESYDVYSDPSGSVVYLMVKKAKRVEEPR
jgi:extracellular factor (EF) 3-hydroxypalmitic acid methyl ester biosynthesis protein